MPQRCKYAILGVVCMYMAGGDRRSSSVKVRAEIDRCSQALDRDSDRLGGLKNWEQPLPGLPPRVSLQ